MMRLPAAFTIDSPLTGDSTQIRFSRGDRDQRYPPEDFTVAAVKALLE